VVIRLLRNQRYCALRGFVGPVRRSARAKKILLASRSAPLLGYLLAQRKLLHKIMPFYLTC